MTQLRKRVLEELERRNYSQATARAYVGAIWRLAKHFHRSPDQLDLDQIREYQLHLVKRGLRPKTVMIQMAALRFLFVKVLRRRYTRDDLPLPKTPKRQLPVVLSREEVGKLIECASNLRHRTILMALYATGMRRAELCLLRTEDVDEERMVIRVRHGKGGKEREVPLSPKLLDQLRTYCHSLKCKTGWVFPSLQTKRAGEPMTCKTIWHACEFAARRAGIAKHVHPHTLRHCFATHLFDSGAELPVVQTLLGHSDPRDTMIYLEVSTRKLRAAPNPLDTLELAGNPSTERASS